MATAQTPATTNQGQEQLPAISGPRLPFHPLIEQRFGIDRASWKALVEAIFPGASTVESVVLALSYCKARNLDPFKRNVHIVPIWDSKLRKKVDTIWPGIGELRTTAFRTGDYAGRDATAFGIDIKQKVGAREVTYPEWAQVTLYRMVKGQRVAFAGPRVYWIEAYATIAHDDDTPNSMWSDRPRGQIDKCAEAAALRAAFPEECGGDYIPEEVQHRKAAIDVESRPAAKKLDDLTNSLKTEYAEAPYKPPISADQEHADDVHQGEHIEDLNQDSEPEQDPNVFMQKIKADFESFSTLKECGEYKDLISGDPSVNEGQKELIAKWCDTAMARIRSKRTS